MVQQDDNQLRQRLRRAAFPVIKTLDAFDLTALPTPNRQKVLSLSQCEYIDRKENALLVGNSGTGRTHLATGLGVAACRKGYRVRFWRVAELVEELLEAQHVHHLSRPEKQCLRLDAVILDELGYVSLTRTGSELLFHFLTARYERDAVIVTTNLEFAEWAHILGDEKMTAALVDRLTHRAHILNMNGENYRCRESLRRQEVIPGD